MEMKSFIPEFGDFLEKKRATTITVSGMAGSGKTTVAKRIAERFNLKRVTVGDIFREMAKEKGKEITEFLEKVTPEKDREADRRTLKLAARGGVVIDSRLSGWVAGNFSDFRIFIKAPLDERAKRVAGRERISKKEAILRVKKRDSNDISRYKKLYGLDLENLSIYDLVLDNKCFSKKETAEILTFALEKKLGRRE